jgi:hypothetical protein
VIVFLDGRVATGLPMNNPNDYDKDTDQFHHLVLGLEGYESLALLAARFDGLIVLVSLLSMSRYSCSTRIHSARTRQRPAAIRA